MPLSPPEDYTTFLYNKAPWVESTDPANSQPLSLFLSVIISGQNWSKSLPAILSKTIAQLEHLCHDFELIVIDNASTDGSVAVLKQLTREEGLPNLQVYALTNKVSRETACCIGMQHALGDFVAVVDPLTKKLSFLQNMLQEAADGADIVFAQNAYQAPLPKETRLYRWSHTLFCLFYKWINGIDIQENKCSYRLLSRNVATFITTQPQPVLSYSHLPAMAGFSQIHLVYNEKPSYAPAKKRLSNALNKGIEMLVANGRIPMRLVTYISCFGSIANVLYSFYVLFIALLKENVAPGWVSLSLQQSGMFFLISTVLMVLGEYILYITTFSNAGLHYHIAQEFSSVKLQHQERLNIEDSFPLPSSNLSIAYNKVI